MHLTLILLNMTFVTFKLIWCLYVKIYADTFLDIFGAQGTKEVYLLNMLDDLF